MKGRALVLAALVAILAVLSWRAARRWSQHRAVSEICNAARDGDWERALERSASRVGTDPAGLVVGECRALAFFGAGRREEGAELLSRLIEETTEREWLPAPELVAMVVAVDRERGRLREAAALSRRAALVYPTNRELFLLELGTRLEVEGPRTVIDDLARRLEGMGEAEGELRLRLARASQGMGLFDRARRLFGSDPPADPTLAEEWYRWRAVLAASDGDAETVASVCRRWVASGGGPVDVMAWHAVLLSVFQLQDSSLPVIPALEECLRRRGELVDRSWLEQIYVRLIGHLALSDRSGEALAYLEQARAEGIELSWSTDDILRSGPGAIRDEAKGQTGRIRWRPPATGIAGTLWVSPGPDQPYDAPWEALEIEGGAEVERRTGSMPQRWVLLDEEGRTRSSGAVWATATAVQEVGIELRPPPSPPDRLSWNPGPADGRRRVALVILDCADWRLVQYLRFRGELPALDHLLQSGARAVLWSEPAFTAAALRKIVFPGGPPSLSPLQALFELGLEIQGNSFVSRNPFAGLSFFLPERSSLFEALGAGEASVLNLLYAEGGLEGGRQGQIVGPRGEQRRFEHWRRRRALFTEERQLLLGRPPGSDLEGWLEEAAADFDSLERAFEEDVDTVLMRVAVLDIATHKGLREVNRGTQDDGAGELYDLYRYLDRRLGGFLVELDRDDALVVMSDHGIATGMQHDPRALFVAVGGGIRSGRLPGEPEIAGVPRFLAELMGRPTEWPSSGLESVLEPTP